MGKRQKTVLTRKPFLWIHKLVWKDKRLGGSELKVYGTLAMLADNDTQQCFPSIKTICKKSRISARSIIRALQKLEKCGYIVIKKYHGEVNFYTLLEPIENKYNVSPKDEDNEENGGSADLAVVPEGNGSSANGYEVVVPNGKTINTHLINTHLTNSEKQVFALSNSFFSSLEGYFIQGYKQRYGIEPVLNYAKDRSAIKSRTTAALKKAQKWPPGPEDLAAFEAHGKKLIDFFLTTEKAEKYPSLAVVFSADTINQFKFSQKK